MLEKMASIYVPEGLEGTGVCALLDTVINARQTMMNPDPSMALHVAEVKKSNTIINRNRA